MITIISIIPVIPLSIFFTIAIIAFRVSFRQELQLQSLGATCVNDCEAPTPRPPNPQVAANTAKAEVQNPSRPSTLWSATAEGGSSRTTDSRSTPLTTSATTSILKSIDRSTDAKESMPRSNGPEAIALDLGARKWRLTASLSAFRQAQFKRGRRVNTYRNPFPETLTLSQSQSQLNSVRKTMSLDTSYWDLGEPYLPYQALSFSTGIHLPVIVLDLCLRQFVGSWGVQNCICTTLLTLKPRWTFRICRLCQLNFGNNSCPRLWNYPMIPVSSVFRVYSVANIDFPLKAFDTRCLLNLDSSYLIAGQRLGCGRGYGGWGPYDFQGNELTHSPVPKAAKSFSSCPSSSSFFVLIEACINLAIWSIQILLELTSKRRA